MKFCDNQFPFLLREILFFSANGKCVLRTLIKNKSSLITYNLEAWKRYFISSITLQEISSSHVLVQRVILIGVGGDLGFSAFCEINLRWRFGQGIFFSSMRNDYVQLTRKHNYVKLG